MNRLPNIEMTADADLEIKDLSEDLKIINEDVPKQEDLSADPFERAPPLKQAPPKPKRRVSEKQKQHLANARKLAREKKQKQKQEKLKPVKEEPKEEPKKEEVHEPVEKVEKDEEAEFEKWCVNMDKYGMMMNALKKAQQKKELERQIKEQEIEQKYYKKFLLQQEEQRKKNKPSQTIKPKPSNPIDILNKNDYGEYSNYF